MKRAAIIASFATLLWMGASAHAQSCPTFEEPNDLDTWPMTEQQQAILDRVPGHDWEYNARLVRLLREQLEREARSDPHGFFGPLAAFLKRVERDYDGTAATASKLAVDAVKPVRCGDDGNLPPEPLCAWEILGDAERRKMPLSTQDPAIACAYREKLGGYLHTVVDLLELLQRPHIESAARSLRRHDMEWERLVTRGFSQWPWEVLINRHWTVENGWGPSPNQLVLGHAFAGVGVGNVGGKHGEPSFAAAIVGVEALGFLRYFSDFRFHVGAGIAGTMANLSKSQLAAGPVLHVAGMHLGYGYSFDSAAEHTLYLLLDVTRGIDNSLLHESESRAFDSYARK